MIDLYSLVKETGAFKTVKGEKESGRLSHAYLILTADGENLTEYLKIFARLMVCNNGSPCNACRACTLIEKNAYSDVYSYPKEGASVTSEEVNSLIEESYLKPVEGNKKIFILTHAETMNAAAQNKLLKTLEEPPENVHILIGATSEFPLLSTVKSRVKKLEIPPFGKEMLFNALKEDCPDAERLSAAIACSDGTVGNAFALYNDQSLKEITDLACEIITDMQSSKDVLKYSTKITSSKCDISKFLSVMELLFRDVLIYFESGEKLVGNPAAFEKIKNAKNFTVGSIINALEKITEAQKRKKFNANATMLLEWLLFQILEGKYKWQKL